MSRVLALATLLAAVGCAAPAERFQAPERVAADPELEQLVALAEIFYDRMSNRRFNTIASFQDPGLREFFRSTEAWSDYFADLSGELETARFEANRPTFVTIEGIALEEDAAATLRVKFTGENGRPLRWWSSNIVREDRWLYSEGRWWIIPGKV
ncbi:MAG: hypothetical protein MJE66_21810 [Proteobacteria bacterium]|nr:hypothetical protein [Pseudomonadota bacterium]